MNNSDLTRFVESMSFDKRHIREVDSEQIRESLSRVPSKLRESISEENPSKGWWVPISIASDYRKNGNGRIYGKQLWKNVIDNQASSYQFGGMLADHPAGDSDGNPKDICGVWLDAKMGEPYGEHGDQVVYGLLVPSGRLGEDLQDHLRNGMKIGTSTSGFGKLMRDGVTVDPDTYQIERLADWVLNPSASVYFGYDENGQIEDRSIKESQKATNTLKEDLNNNTKKSIIKEESMEDSKFTKLEQKKFRRDMESFLERADTIADPQERLNEFKEIRSFLEDGVCPDLKESIEKKIAEQESQIKKMLNDSIEMKEKLGIKDSKDLKEKLTRISEDVQFLEKENKDWKAISEKMQDKYSKIKEELESRPTEKYVAYLKEKNTKILNGSIEKIRENEELQGQVNDLTQQVNDYTEKCDKLSKELEETKKCADESCKDKECVEGECKESLKKADTTIKESIGRINSLLKVIESQRKVIEENTNRICELEDSNKKLQESLNNKTEQMKELLKENKDSRARVEKYKNVIQAKTDTTSIVDKYYESLYESYGNEIKPFEKLIRNARTLQEAKNIFYREVIQNLEESQEVERARLPESMYLSVEDRIESFGANKFTKTGIFDRKPKGWN